MTRGWHIIRYRNQVKADRRLHAVDFTVAFQLTERTNKAEFEKSGRLVTWQGADTMAAATGLHERTVQRSVRRLQSNGHLAVITGGGRWLSNRYELILKTPVETPAESHPLATETPAVSTQNPGRLPPELLNNI